MKTKRPYLTFLIFLACLPLAAFCQDDISWFDSEAVAGHTVRVIPDGATLLNERLAAINSAKRSIFLSTFIFDEDISPRQIGYALCQQAKRGIEVRVLLDGFGGKAFYHDYADSLRECGAGVLLFNPPQWGLHKIHYVIHEKLLIIDGQTVMMGGNGMGDAYHKLPGAKKYYHDMDVKIDGPAACYYHRAFSKNWHQSLIKARKTGALNYETENSYRLLSDMKILSDCEFVIAGRSKVLALYNNPLFSKKRPIWQHYQQAFKSAKQSIKLYAPYFVPHNKFINALSQALARGVDVTIMTNSIESNDEGFVTLVGMLIKIRTLLKQGLKIRLYKGPETLHRKGGIFDAKWAFFGSDNLDNRGHQYQSESVIFTDSADAIASIQNEYSSDESNSVSLDKKYVDRIWNGAGRVKRWLIRHIFLKQL